MMFGGGFMLDMMNKVKENLAMLPSRQPKYMEGRRPKYTWKQNGRKLNFKEVSKSELEEVIGKIKLNTQEEKRKHKLLIAPLTILIAILILVVVLFVFDLLLEWYWSSGNNYIKRR